MNTTIPAKSNVRRSIVNSDVLTALIGFGILVVIFVAAMYARPTQAPAAASAVNAPVDTTDYWLRHPELKNQPAGVNSVSEFDPSDYYFRHRLELLPKANNAVSPIGADMSDYYLRHRLELQPQPDTTDWYVRHRAALQPAPDLSDWYARHRSQ